MKKRKSNWSIIKNQNPRDNIRNRNVYEDQQLERGNMAEVETMTSRNIINLVICSIAFILIWVFVSLFEMFFSAEGTELSLNPSATWIRVESHYETADGSDKITMDEYQHLVDTFSTFDGTEVLEPVQPVKHNSSDYKWSTEYQGYVINGDRDTWISKEEWNNLGDTYRAEMEQYQKDLAAYKAYLRNTTDPSEHYRLIPAHYRNRYDLNEAIYEDAYSDLVLEYETMVASGRISDDEKSVPIRPFDPSALYAPDMDADTDTVSGFDSGFDSDSSSVLYRNVLDGTVIANWEYQELVNKYTQDMAVYKEKYLQHRQTWHPDDIDGTKLVFTMEPTKTKFIVSFVVSAVLFGIIYVIMSANLRAANLTKDHTDINQYHNDQHVALPEEIQRNYDWFPDLGAHSAVPVSSMISHMAIKNKGLKKVALAKRAEKDIRDESGDIVYFKGEIIEDEDGKPIVSQVPIIDTKFMDEIFDVSDVLASKDIRVSYDATAIEYNPGGKNRDKLGKYETVADLINEDWEFPLYEPQRPAGAYIVDTAPVNTMILAITRAGKGQTVIEPTIDMWTREKRLNNMVINDPKGELLVKNYVRATVRGLQVVQFNLINAMKTDIYNPLAMAADAAREGDSTKCAMYVENIAEVFFPLDGGEDPVWPNAANNAFKRSAYGLIDYYLEEEKAMRRMAERTGLNDKILEQNIDAMWGKVTLYNCYQLFVQLSSKKMKNPAVEFSNQAKAGKFNDLSDEEYEIELQKVKNKSRLWEDKPEADLLTLYFNATDALPRNSMRTLVGNANNALRSMGGAEKMMASVYGIAITAMVRCVAA